MALKLFELCGTDPERVFSPYCWRSRMALAHKGLTVQAVPWRYSEKDVIKPYDAEKVPVLLDGETSVVDSWAIANYLEDHYTDRPSLFGGEGGRAMARMLNWWGDTTAMAGFFPIVAPDVPKFLGPDDQVYFRKTREARLGKSLEEAASERDANREVLMRALDPVRLTLKTQPFIGGQTPNYADYILFGMFQWARVVSTYKLLKEDDPVYAWRERLLDAFGGMARNAPGFAV